MTLSRAERETIVRWIDDDSEEMTVYTHSRKGRDRMKRFGARLARTTVLDGREVAWEFKCPRKWFRWPGKPRKASAAIRAVLQDARSRSKVAAGATPEEAK